MTTELLVLGPVWALLASFVGGLAVGSFLNVCIYRLPRGESVVSPRSRCPHCDRGLEWFENIPVVAYVALHGRCRRCGEPIALMYPVVELVTGGLFVLHCALLGWQPLLVVRLVFCCAMVVLFVIDLRDRLLPDVVTLSGIGVGVAASAVTDGGPGWSSALVGAAAGGGGLFVLAEAYFRVRHEEGLGLGDVKMLAMIGAFLGWPQVLLTLMMASVLGAIVGIALMGLGLAGRKYPLPFGSFLAVTAVTVSLVGESIVAWYVRVALG